MAITTTSRLTITSAERDRVDAEVNSLNASVSALNASVASLTSANANQLTQIVGLESSLAAALGHIATLENELALRPPASRPGLYVDGGKLRTKNGAELVLRGMEIMIGQDSVNRGLANVVNDIKAMGCNGVSPLFQAWYDSNGVKTFDSGTVAQVRAFCDIVKAAGLVCVVNGDHRRLGSPPASALGGRAWLCQPDMVTLLNSYSNVILACEVETDSVPTGTSGDAPWVSGANNLVAELRAAGHIHPIKVGAPQGGRRVEHPLRAGAQVLAADPLKNVLFTFQAYWPEATTSSQQWYQNCAGVAPGLAGTKAALGQCAASGLCFLPGLDWRDDIGLTGAVALSAHCDTLGLGYQYWVYSHDGISDNNVIGHWNLLPANTTANGLAIGAALRVRGATLAQLG
jgi:hypothetical protein